MPIDIDEIQTDVHVQEGPEPAAAEAASAPWQQLQDWRALQRQCLADAARTQACGNDSGDG